MNPFDIRRAAPGLEEDEPGIWFGPRARGVSYPDQANAAYSRVEDRSFWFRHRNRCIVSLVRLFPPQGVLLDIGGGNGFVAQGLAEAGFACALLEPGLDGARAARARGVGPVICATLKDAGLAPGSIGAAGLFDVIEHIEDEATALREVWRILEPGGRLFVTVPAYQWLYSADDEAAGHFRRYTAASLRRALEAAGFRVEFATYLFLFLPPVVFALRTLPSRLGLRVAPAADLDPADHAPGGAARFLVDAALAAEYALLRRGVKSPAGGSCLCVAVKI